MVAFVFEEQRRWAPPVLTARVLFVEVALQPRANSVQHFLLLGAQFSRCCWWCTHIMVLSPNTGGVKRSRHWLTVNCDNTLCGHYTWLDCWPEWVCVRHVVILSEVWKQTRNYVCVCVRVTVSMWSLMSNVFKVLLLLVLWQCSYTWLHIVSCQETLCLNCWQLNKISFYVLIRKI